MMNTLLKLKRTFNNNGQSQKLQGTIKLSSLLLKTSLTALLLTSVMLTGGCVSESRVSILSTEMVIDASLMDQPKLTEEMLDVLSK